MLGTGFSTYDYTWRCTKCLSEYQVVENRLYGIPYHTTKKLRFVGYDLIDVVGTPCQHVYRKGGYGEESWGLISVGISDGMTAEGNLFQARWCALKSAFSLYDRFHNKVLLQRTFRFADSVLPSDANVADSHLYPNWGLLTLLGFKLEAAQSEEEWQNALAEIEKEALAK